jgi:hypothetical protein
VPSVLIGQIVSRANCPQRAAVDQTATGIDSSLHREYRLDYERQSGWRLGIAPGSLRRPIAHHLSAHSRQIRTPSASRRYVVWRVLRTRFRAVRAGVLGSGSDPYADSGGGCGFDRERTTPGHGWSPCPGCLAAGLRLSVSDGVVGIWPMCRHRPRTCRGGVGVSSGG